MKKLIIGAAIAMVGLATNAATANWTAGGTIIEGDVQNWDGTYAPSGWSVYFFDNAGAVTRGQMLVALTADNFATEMGSALTWSEAGVTVNHASIQDGGAFGANGTTMVGVKPQGETVETVSGYFVIFDAASYDKATYAYLSADVTGTVNTFGTATMDPNNIGEGWDTYLDATTYHTSNWTAVNAVPEPTSGLLLLLGVAGLALKRKRA